MDILELFTTSATLFELVSVQQMLLNWKGKAMFFSGAKTGIIICYWARYGQISYSFILSTIVTMAYVSIILYDGEQTLMAVYLEKEENRKEKVKWISILDTLPIFVMIYDKCK